MYKLIFFTFFVCQLHQCNIDKEFRKGLYISNNSNIVILIDSNKSIKMMDDFHVIGQSISQNNGKNFRIELLQLGNDKVNYHDLLIQQNDDQTLSLKSNNKALTEF